MKLSDMKLWAILVIALLATSSCEKEEGENETMISSYHSDESHKAGVNCMECHVSGGPGEGWFTVAGTVYESDRGTPYPNATIRFYTGPEGTGELKAILEGDQLGNFYTTEQIDFSNGLFVTVEGTSQTNAMHMELSNGACNQCHGSTTDRIWTQ